MAGVAFKKTFSYAGFEMQPKKYENPKIALLNVELELKAERDNAEVRVNNVEVRKNQSTFPVTGTLCLLRCDDIMMGGGLSCSMASYFISTPAADPCYGSWICY